MSVARSCWSFEDARAILVTEALAGDDALFLATHTPVHGFEIRGADTEVHDEEGLLRVLSDPSRKHAFCVIQGEPGSGKSHVIRWLSVNWPKNKDLTVLIQRADGSLEGALRQLQTRLPGEFAHLFENLGRRQAAALSGRAYQFLLTLGAALAPNHFSKPMEDVEWCAENDPSSLLLSKDVRNNWTGPRRILELLDGGAGKRNSATASFNFEDIIDLVRHSAHVHDSSRSERLAQRLRREVSFAQNSIAEDRTLDAVLAERPSELRSSFALIDALNARRNYAVQSVIGISADGLKKMFQELRAELAKADRRLVLLLEDITSWEGLDDTLVDALVTDSQTRSDSDLCPLISVVGVTPEYFRTLRANYKQRISHDVCLGQEHGQLQDVASLREREDRTAFVTRYLAAARAGTDQLHKWRERFRSNRDLPPPNVCETCPRAEACHEIFGQVNGIGLFPFTTEAVDTFFFALKEDDGGMTQRTPRGLIQGVLSPTLLSPHVLDDGQYPGPQIESAALERRPIPGVLKSRLEAQVANASVRERLRRLLSYWGDLRSELRRDDKGRETYAGLSKDLVTAFGLPWIADDISEPATERKPTPTGDGKATPQAPVTPTGEEENDQQGQARSRGRTQLRRVTTQPRVPRSSLERLRQEIESLRNKQPLQNSTGWNRALSEILACVDHCKLGVDRWTWSKIFTPENVKIEGTGSIRAAHFVVYRTDWLADGLEAFVALKTEDLLEEEAEYSRRRLAFMIHKLESLASAHIDKRLMKGSQDVRWNPVTTTVQILLARAWLRGVTSADRPTYEQWSVMLSDEVDAESEPAARTQAWQEALSATKNRHDQFRRALREMVRLPQGTSPGLGIFDASNAAEAIIALRGECALSFVPDGDSREQSDIEAIREVGDRLSALPKIPLQEKRLLFSRTEELFRLLRNQSIPSHLRRLDDVITGISERIPKLASHLVRDWKANLERQRRLLDEPSVSARLQSLMVDIIGEGKELPSSNSYLLGWLAAAPATDLKASLDLAQQGERLVQEFLPNLRDMSKDAQRAPDLTMVRSYGATLRTAAAKVKSMP